MIAGADRSTATTAPSHGGDELIQVERFGSIAIIRLNRPAKRNSLNREMIDSLIDVFTALRDSADGTATIDAVVLAGAPGAFCAGADIASYHRASAADLAEFTQRALTLVNLVRSAPVPVIASIDGMALGGGLELALAADFIVASERATLGLPETRIGLIPGWAGTASLTEAIGVRRAKQVIYSGMTLSAQQALQWGLVNHVAPEGTSDKAAQMLATEIAQRAPLAVRAAKRAVHAASATTIGTTTETDELLDLFASADGIEGVAAFVEKRPARFRSL